MAIRLDWRSQLIEEINSIQNKLDSCSDSEEKSRLERDINKLKLNSKPPKKPHYPGKVYK